MKGKKTGGRDFQKGHKAFTNPLTEEAMELRKMSLEDFIRAAREILHMTPEQAKVLAEDKQTPYFKRIILKVICKGDFKEINMLMERLFGKPKEIIEATTNNTHTITSDDRKQIINDLLALRQKAHDR